VDCLLLFCLDCLDCCWWYCYCWC